MTSWLGRFGITVAFLGFASTLPATVGAQPPAYLTQWGSHGGGNGQFQDPFGVATDAAGNVYVADTGNNRIQKFSSTGTYLTQWGSPAGTGDGQLNSPFGVATDAAGNVYVSDTGNNRVQKFSSTGAYLTQWGLPADSSGGLFNGPLGIATDAAGNVYVSDQSYRVQKFTGTGTYITQWGSFGYGDGEFSYFPFGLTTDLAGNVYVSDFGSNRIEKFTGTGTYLTQWGSFGSGDGQFLNPYGLATDAGGNVYVVDFDNNRIQKFDGTGTYLTQWGSLGSGDGQFSSPRAVATDAAGNVYVADQGNQRIQKFGSATTTISIAFDFTPNTLNLVSHGPWVTGYLEPASPFAAGDIDVSSIRLNGTVPVDPAAPTALGDHNGNGVPDLTVKFNRTAVELTLTGVESAAVVVTGTLGGAPFTGTDDISVRHAVVSAPAAGSHLTAGSVTQVRWETPIGVSVQWVDVLRSLDGGSTWSLIAHGEPNTGSYDWTVPNVQSDQAKVAVVLVESVDETGDIMDGALGVSDGFSIDGTAGVGDLGTAQLALRGVMPNPVQDELRVSFSLRSSQAASLALFDVSGRQLASRRVEGMGAGWHTVTLGEQSSLPAGLYIIRLTQGGRSLTTRAAVTR